MEQGLIYLSTVKKLWRVWNCSNTIIAKKYFKKDWPVDNVKKTGLNRYVCGFSVNYNDIAVDDILDTGKWLIKKMI